MRPIADRDLRVAIFLPDLSGGGAERVFALLAQELAARGIATEVILVKARGPHLAAVRDVVPVIDLDARATRYSLVALARHLRRSRPDVLVTALDHANLVAIWARMLARVPTAVVVGHHRNVRLTVDGRSAETGLWGRLVRWFYPRADAIVAVSHGAAAKLAIALGLDVSRIDVIYNPVIPDDLESLGRAPTAHPWLAPGRDPVIMGIGRLVPEKDFSSLIQAVGIVRQARPVRLIILGEGPERTMLEARVAELGLGDAVSMPGFVGDPYSHLARASVFVLSSVSEALPTVLIEALALGVPVVSTDCDSGPSEILDGGALGRLVPERDPEALAAAILETLATPVERPTADRLERYRRSVAVDAYLRLFRRVARS